MKKLLLPLLFLGCAPSVNVPSTVETTQCIKTATGTCTSELMVKHVISIELPAVLTDSCRATWNPTDFPDEAIRNAGYNKCVQDYINSILELIKGINPSDLPPIDTVPGI